MKRMRLTILVALLLTCGFAIHAQDGARPFVPVTDAMLQKPSPADWLMWRRTLDGWGYSPLEPDQPRQRRTSCEWSGRAAWVRANIGSDAARLQRRDVSPESGRPHSGDRCEDRRPDLGVPAQAARGPATLGTNRNLAIYGNTIIDTSADNQVYALDAQTGKLAWETQILDPTKPANASSGPIIANGKVITGRQCEPDGRHDACVITAHDAKTGQGALAHAHDSAARRAGRRDLGRRADGAALARRHVDGAELRPRAEPDLRRHVGDDPGAEVHARRQRQEVPLSQLARSR